MECMGAVSVVFFHGRGVKVMSIRREIKIMKLVIAVVAAAVFTQAGGVTVVAPAPMDKGAILTVSPLGAGAGIAAELMPIAEDVLAAKKCLKRSKDGKCVRWG